MSLSQLLTVDTTRTLSDDSGSWRQYVLDHLDYISARTQVSNIDKLLMNQYRYDLARFLKEKLGRQRDIAWIVLLVNNMTSDMDFSEPGHYILPTDDLIEKLFHSYTTIERNSF